MEQHERKAQILEAAIRRFAHFGVQKTTLTEIADDLGMTKQALAYYFPDKQHLSQAVEAAIISEFLKTVETHLSQATSAADAMMELVEVKRTFIEKYAMLMQAAGPGLMKRRNQPDGPREQVRRSLVLLIADRLEKGTASGELKPLNASETAALVYDTMTAFEQCAIGRRLIPDATAFTELCTRQKAVLQLMMNGLKEDACKN